MGSQKLTRGEGYACSSVCTCRGGVKAREDISGGSLPCSRCTLPAHRCRRSTILQLNVQLVVNLEVFRRPVRTASGHGVFCPTPLMPSM